MHNNNEITASFGTITKKEKQNKILKIIRGALKPESEFNHLKIDKLKKKLHSYIYFYNIL
jgi:hypothetical protein